jgi:hypothetical protein
MSIKRLPPGFIIPAQPITAARPRSGPDWVHEIKHDGYRIIVRRDGPTVRLYSRNAHDWSARLSAIAAAAARIKANSFTIDGEAVVLGPDGLSRFEELRSRKAAHAAILYAFDLIEHDGEDMRNLPFLDRKNARGCCASPRPASYSMSTSPRCRLRARLPAWGRGHRVEEGRWRLSIWPVPRLDQGPQSRQPRRAAGAQRDVESASPRHVVCGHFRWRSPRVISST